MRNTRRTAVLGLTAGFLAVGLATAPAGANNGNGKGPNKLIQLQVLSFNDYHGHLEKPGGDNPANSTLGRPGSCPRSTALGGAEYLVDEAQCARAPDCHQLGHGRGR